MRLASPWTPRIAAGAAPAYERLIAALVEDITAGLIPAGARLPAHRELAFQLKIGLGTVTKAYGMLERRGLVQSMHGRGMFVASGWVREQGRAWIGGLHHGDARPSIDLAINIPPQALSNRLLTATFSLLAKKLHADDFGRYRPAIGLPTHQILLARYLATRGLEVAPETLLLCHGAQHALAVAFKVACPPDGLLLTEAFTFPGAIALARSMNLTVQTLAMDNEGITPHAFEQALRAREAADRPVALYTIPTLQNPTAVTMGEKRRRDIVRLARRHGVTIIEDDVYAIFAPDGVPPLAQLAPERTLHVTGFSKTMSPGLRVGLVTTPPVMSTSAIAALQATSTMASPISCAILEQWLTDGTATSIEAAIRAEALARMDLAQDLLGRAWLHQPNPGFHIWLPMAAAQADRIVHEAAAAGVILTPAAAFTTDASARDSGLRLCLGGPTRDELTLGLKIVRRLLDQSQSAMRQVI
ncbi:aminotransferase-like domain-containing protein [Methylovirgula sp. 4M-Z18]|uniref:aminotransferase-like domain-containing protein n=1 Tax=Methylovirgula sp. 4M-Z18 TaxID=2293567 RepID=UPI000E2EF0B4|nr:PLP-dependent aminotransferase family protein [Methylovirgula sp. 4M-Z18]RFB81166.1 PLP-dependent aminotransferase family protein [Methylovirgula sp. 4M-Z18]